MKACCTVVVLNIVVSFGLSLLAVGIIFFGGVTHFNPIMGLVFAYMGLILFFNIMLLHKQYATIFRKMKL